ncbi:MAG TPA: type II toxin-antitoxin system PemK/MazF family toxin [Candidatus Limosilactobacillus faecipullorum]|nr:type II toxin-antitoxin system PemK/MazF family toxin [Candidatus Limosilactobacillus faecipullorum]
MAFQRTQEIMRGDIFYADLDPVIGSEQGGVRPVLVVQNDVGNLHSPTVIIAAITTKLTKHRLPTHVFLAAADSGIAKNSMILLEQVRTIDKHRLRQRVTHINPTIMKRVDHALRVSFHVK